MADATDTGPIIDDEAINNINAAASGAETLAKNLDDAVAGGAKFTAIIGSSDMASQLNSTMGAFSKASGELKKNSNIKLNVEGNIDQATSRASASMTNLGKSSKGAADATGVVYKDLKNLLGSGGPVMAAFAVKKGVGEFSNVIENLQKPLLAARRQALQLGINLGATFKDANKGVNAFSKSMTETTRTTNTLSDEVYKVQDAMKESLGSSEQFMNLSNLESAHVKLKTSINAVNAAILVGAATGTDPGAVAGLINTAVMEFNDNADEAVLNLGHIRSAAEGSGFSFQKTAETVMEATQSIKLWGGSVNAVTPIFNTFSESLSAIGKGKFAPDLVKKFVGGLGGMDLSTRAFMGMQTPGVSGKGALGAGLEMEAALEGGPEGMEKIMESFTSTLKQFGGGGGIITREEAIADPGLEMQFVLQRKLLMQTAGVSQQEATQMMHVLKSIDEGGMKGTQDAKEKFNELMGSGEAVQEQTTDLMVKAQVRVESQVLSSGEDIVSSVNSLAEGLGVDRAIGGASKQFDVVNQRGKFRAGDIKDAEDRVSGANISARNARSRLDAMAPDDPKRKQAVERLVGAQRNVKNANLALEMTELRKSMRDNAIAAKKAGEMYIEGVGDVTKKERNQMAAGKLPPRVMADMVGTVSGALGKAIDASIGSKEPRDTTPTVRDIDRSKEPREPTPAARGTDDRPTSSLGQQFQRTSVAVRDMRSGGISDEQVQELIKKFNEVTASLKEKEPEQRDLLPAINRGRFSDQPGVGPKLPAPDQFPQAPVNKVVAVEEKRKLSVDFGPVDLDVKINVIGGEESVKITIDKEAMSKKIKGEIKHEKNVTGLER